MTWTYAFSLIGPMQAWGIQSKFFDRDTAKEPSKSGVIGMISAALGRNRNDSVEDLFSLRFGVRIDKEGLLQKDYQTTSGAIKANGSPSEHSIITQRYYLSDAIFVVFLEGDLDILKTIDCALRTPVWSLYLGRKSFPLTCPPVLEFLGDDRFFNGTIEEAMKTIPWLCCDKKDPSKNIRTAIETDERANSGYETVVYDSLKNDTYSTRNFTRRVSAVDFIPLDELPVLNEKEYRDVVLL